MLWYRAFGTMTHCFCWISSLGFSLSLLDSFRCLLSWHQLAGRPASSTNCPSSWLHRCPLRVSLPHRQLHLCHSKHRAKLVGWWSSLPGFGLLTLAWPVASPLRLMTRLSLSFIHHILQTATHTNKAHLFVLHPFHCRQFCSPHQAAAPGLASLSL